MFWEILPLSISEPIHLTLNKMKVYDSLVIKESDNRVKVRFNNNIKNMIVGYDFQKLREAINIPVTRKIFLNKKICIKYYLLGCIFFCYKNV